MKKQKKIWETHEKPPDLLLSNGAPTLTTTGVHMNRDAVLQHQVKKAVSLRSCLLDEGVLKDCVGSVDIS